MKKFLENRIEELERFYSENYNTSIRRMVKLNIKLNKYLLKGFK